MNDLVDFLNARLDEDEAAAKLVRQPYRLYVSTDGRLSEPLRIDDLHEKHDGEYQQWSEGDDRMPNHITNWSLVYDPARVLREVERDRRIIDEHPTGTGWDGHGHDRLVCRTCATATQDGGVEGDPYPCLTLRLLSLPYADHPDYRKEWGPDGS